MPGFLDLPNEILHEIIDNVLSGGQIDIPPNLVRRRASEWESNDFPVAYIPNHAVQSSLGLLLTCRAIHRQTSHLIKNSPCVYRLDLAMVDAAWYYPTWTQIPLRQGAEPGIVDKLEIQIIPCRIDDKDPGMNETFKSTYRLEDTLNSIIERFLAVGVNVGFDFSPDGVAHAKQTFPCNLRVRTIAIDIAKADPADTNTPISHTMIPIRPMEGFIHAEHDVLYPVPIETAIAMHEIFFWR